MQSVLVLYAISAIIFGAFITFFELVIVVALIEVPFIAERYLLISIPFQLKSAIAILLTFHMMGNIEQWYRIYYPYYDKITHLMAGLTLAMIIFVALIIINYYKIKKWNSGTIAALIIIISIPFALIWEIGEISVDFALFRKMHYNLGSWDTSLDLLFDLAGATIIAIYAYLFLSNIPCKDVYSRIIRGRLKKFSNRLSRIDECPPQK